MASTKNERDTGMISMIVCVFEIRHENEFDILIIKEWLIYYNIVYCVVFIIPTDKKPY